ncbi:MAG: TetR/AcrR family transcriptional regulator [Acidimicrobiales bacterium]
MARATRQTGLRVGGNGTRVPGASAARDEPDPVRIVDGSSPVAGVPASKRSLRDQGRRTMRRLLDAAMEAIDQRGYHGTRVQDVVDIANTSHGTFYLYFANKEDLVRALTTEATSEASTLTRAVTEAGSALDIGSWGHLRTWVADYSGLWHRYAALFRSWTDLAAVDQGVGDQIRRMVLAHADAMAVRIEATPSASGLDPEVAGMAIVAMLDRFHFMREFVGEPVDDDALDTLTTMIHRALVRPGSVLGKASSG